jgi:hypothetical protein
MKRPNQAMQPLTPPDIRAIHASWFSDSIRLVMNDKENKADPHLGYDLRRQCVI